MTVPIQLQFGAIEATLAHMFAIPADRVGTLNARLKNLKRKGFPFPVTKGARGIVAVYGHRELLRLSLYFELQNAAVVANRARSLAEKFDDEVADKIYEMLGEQDNAIGYGLATLTKGLGSLQGIEEDDEDEGEDQDGEKPKEGAVMSYSEINAELAAGWGQPVVLIDLRDFAGRMFDALSQATGSERDALIASFRRSVEFSKS